MTEGVQISASQSDHQEVDELEEMLGRLGSYGNIPEVPVANSARSVFWFAPTAAGDGDATTAGNAAAGAYDNVATYCTANLRDVCIYLAGSYDFDGAAGGLDISIRGAKVFGLGGLTLVENSNVAATYVMNIANNKWDIEVAGFKVSEATNTVEGIFCDGDYCDIHDNLFIGAMENAIHISGSTYNKIYDNEIESSTNDGIEVSGGAGSNKIWKNIIREVGDNGINLNGDDVDNCYVWGNIINGTGSTATGIIVALGDYNIIVDNWIHGCSSHISDTGTGNEWDNWVGEYNTDFTFTNAMGVAKQTLVAEYDCARPGPIYVKIDISALHDAGEGGVSFWRVEESGGGDVYGFDTFNEGVDEQFPVIKDVPVKSGADCFDITGQLGVAATVNRIVTIYIYERG